MNEFEPMKRGEWGFPEPAVQQAVDNESDMLTIAWLDGFHRGKEKRPWVDLTDDELREFDIDPVEARKLIAKLKGKNA